MGELRSLVVLLLSHLRWHSTQVEMEHCKGNSIKAKKITTLQGQVKNKEAIMRTLADNVKAGQEVRQ
ncbi:hypothetical protein ACLOJK_021205 [Asimina triloba]